MQITLSPTQAHPFATLRVGLNGAPSSHFLVLSEGAFWFY